MQRYLVLIAAALGWFCAGFLLAITSLVMRDAARDLLPAANEAVIARWVGWLTSAFLLGAATGGYGFGWLGDRLGRAKAMGCAILTYSLLSGLCAFAPTAELLLLGWYLACTGVGGMWPNAIALVSEVWSNLSRPLLAGVIGASANLGILLFAIVATVIDITPDHWRWVFMVSAAPAVLGVFVLLAVPESPRWLALRSDATATRPAAVSPLTVFRPPVLRTTLIGIALGAVPLFGGWGSSNWANTWASKVGEQRQLPARYADQVIPPDPGLKARVLISRSLPGSISSLLGAGLAVLLGRRLCYFLLSLCALASAQTLFWFLTPADPRFLWCNGALGLFSGFFFGWLPLCLPELFPTRCRAAGAGVSFNFGRIITAVGVLLSAELLKQVFHGDYAQIGRVTSLVYALGMIVILFAPTTATELED